MCRHSLVQTKQVFDFLVLQFTFQSHSDGVSSILAILFLVVFIVFPLFGHFVLYRNFEILGKHSIKKTIGSLYDGVRVVSHITLMNNAVFMFRRLFFAIVAVFLQNNPGIQIQVLIPVNCVYVLYHLFVPLYSNPLTNKMECVNEVCILIFTYLLLLLTDLTPDQNFQYYVGWSLILLSLFLICTNLGVMVVVTMRSIMKRGRWKWQQLKTVFSKNQNTDQRKRIHLLEELSDTATQPKKEIPQSLLEQSAVIGPLAQSNSVNQPEPKIEADLQIREAGQSMRGKKKKKKVVRRDGAPNQITRRIPEPTYVNPVALLVNLNDEGAVIPTRNKSRLADDSYRNLISKWDNQTNKNENKILKTPVFPNND